MLLQKLEITALKFPIRSPKQSVGMKKPPLIEGSLYNCKITFFEPEKS